MKDFFSSEFWSSFYNKALDWVITELPSILVIILVAIITFAVVRIALRKMKKMIIRQSQRKENGDPQETEKRINTLVGIVHGVLKVIIWAIVIMILLKKFGVDIGPILASAGIIGLAVGFGAQELVRDIISGFFLLLEDEVRVGDVAIINGQGGLVERVELRTIRLRDLSGVVHLFQNGKINTLSNMTKEWSAMVFDIGVAYKEDTDKVMEIMKKVSEDLQKDPEFADVILEAIEVFGLDQFGDSAIVIKARIKTKPGKQWVTGREYRKRLKEAFDQQNIEIPFPHTTLYWGEKISPLKLDFDEEALKKIGKS